MATTSRTLQVVLRMKDFATKQFTRFSKTVRGLKKAGAGAFKGLIKGLKSTRTLLLGAAAAATAFKVGLKDPAKFGEELAKVGTLGSEARSKLSEFREEIERIGVLTGSNFEELSEGLFNTISAGIDSNDAIKFLEEANKLAIAGSADLATVVKGTTSVMESYGLSVDQASVATKALFAGQVIAKTTIGELSDSIGGVAVSARSLGIPLDELVTTIAVLAKTSKSTKEAVIQAKNAFLAFQKPSLNLSRILDKLNLGMGATAFEGRTVGEVLTLIAKEAKRTNTPLAQVFTSTKAYEGALALAAKEGKTFAQSLADQRKNTEELSASFDLMNGQLSSTLGSWNNLLRVMGNSAGETAVNALNAGLKRTNNELELSILQARLYGAEAAKRGLQIGAFGSILIDVIEDYAVKFDQAVELASAGLARIFANLKLLAVNSLNFIFEEFTNGFNEMIKIVNFATFNTFNYREVKPFVIEVDDDEARKKATAFNNLRNKHERDDERRRKRRERRGNPFTAAAAAQTEIDKIELRIDAIKREERQTNRLNQAIQGLKEAFPTLNRLKELYDQIGPFELPSLSLPSADAEAPELPKIAPPSDGEIEQYKSATLAKLRAAFHIDSIQDAFSGFGSALVNAATNASQDDFIKAKYGSLGLALAKAFSLGFKGLETLLPPTLQKAEQSFDGFQLAGQAIGPAIENSVGGAIAAIGDRTKSTEEIVTDFFKSLLSQAAQALANQALQSLFKGLAGTNGGQGAIASFFSGFVSSERGNVLPGGFGAFESGAVVRKPTLGLVGEGSNDEAIIPLKNNRFVQVEMVGGGGSKSSPNININVSAVDGDSVRRFVAGSTFRRELNSALSNDGGFRQTRRQA